jgi:hypothetical protein
MQYLGIAKNEKIDNKSENQFIITLPDQFKSIGSQNIFDVYEVEGDLYFTYKKLDEERLSKIRNLTISSIDKHRKTLEGLAK